MVRPLVAGSFGASFCLPASGITKCYGKAENRVLKRVGGKNHKMKKIFLIASLWLTALTNAQTLTTEASMIKFNSIADYSNFPYRQHNWNNPLYC